VHEVGGRRGGAPGGQHIVDEQHPLAGQEGVLVQFQRRLAVLQRVRRRHRAPGELPALTDRHEAHPQPPGHRGAEDEPAGLHPGDHVDAAVGHRLRDGVDHGGEGDRVGQQRGDVPEGDPGRGMVGDVADQGAQALPQPGHRRAHRLPGPERRC
jgi:hypothetical protein